jgi:hypothetical protein
MIRMMTYRAIEKHWVSKAYERLLGELLAARPEAALLPALRPAGTLACAAMGLVRLEELGQAGVAIAERLVRTIVAAQSPSDGGWEDPLVTALCVKALASCGGNGHAIDRGIEYLANLQRPDEGLWPRGPFRRLPGDALVSAGILYALGSDARFARMVNVERCAEWFVHHEGTLDEPTRDLWPLAALRCGMSTLADSHGGDRWWR